MTTKITIAEPKANTQPIEKFKCGEVVTFTPDNEDAKIFAMVSQQSGCVTTPHRFCVLTPILPMKSGTTRL